MKVPGLVLNNGSRRLDLYDCDFVCTLDVGARSPRRVYHMISNS